MKPSDTDFAPYDDSFFDEEDASGAGHSVPPADTGLIGFERTTTAVSQLLASRRPPHAILLTGPQGIGKATFASDLATRLLASPDADAARLMAQQAHPDFRRLMREERKDGKLAQAITVEQVRGALEFAGKTSSIAAKRVILIDAMEDMNRNAANALLKALEEPPAAVTFLCVTHAPGRLLPTIRSRCAVVDCPPLTTEQAQTVIRTRNPQADSGTVRDLTAKLGPRPGLILRLLDDGADEAIAFQSSLHREPQAISAEGIERLSTAATALSPASRNTLFSLHQAWLLDQLRRAPFSGRLQQVAQRAQADFAETRALNLDEKALWFRLMTDAGSALAAVRRAA